MWIYRFALYIKRGSPLIWHITVYLEVLLLVKKSYIKTDLPEVLKVMSCEVRNKQSFFRASMHDEWKITAIAKAVSLSACVWKCGFKMDSLFSELQLLQSCVACLFCISKNDTKLTEGLLTEHREVTAFLPHPHYMIPRHLTFPSYVFIPHRSQTTAAQTTFLPHILCENAETLQLQIVYTGTTL